MTQNYTATRIFLQRANENKKLLVQISTSISKRRTNGWSSEVMEKKYREVSQKHREIVKSIETEINKINDEREKRVLKARYLEGKNTGEISRVYGWNEKFIRHIHDRALLDLEIVLVEAGILCYEDPKADMIKDYKDGYREGFEDGKKEGFSNGFESGYKAALKELYEETDIDDEEDDEDDEESADQILSSFTGARGEW